jgi:glyoxylase-like metal-dependent hydrolase (beta-lactamase superfamily II)
LRDDVLPEAIQPIDLVRVRTHAIVEDDAVSLIDCGHSGSLARIRRGLLGLGSSLDRVRRVICTHGHPDHAGSARALSDLGIEILIHPADADNLSIGFRDAARHPSRGRIFAAMTPDVQRYTPLDDGDVLPVLGGLEVIHTPGHTPGSVCLYSPRHRLLFVGDALQHRFGRVSFASSLYSDDHASARQQVKRLASLDVDILVFSHYPPRAEGVAGILADLADQADRATRRRSRARKGV